MQFAFAFLFTFKNLQSISREVGLSLDVKQQIQVGSDRLRELSLEASKRGTYRLPRYIYFYDT